MITIFVENTTFYDLQFAKHLTDVQTDVHIVPIDSDAQTCNLLILSITGGARYVPSGCNQADRGC